MSGALKLGYQYRIPVLVVNSTNNADGTHTLICEDSSVDGGIIRFSTDGTMPTAASKVMESAVKVQDLDKSDDLR